MRILIVAPPYAPFVGVGSHRMVSLSKYLADKGEDVTVLRNNPICWGEESLKMQVPDNIKIVDAPIEDNLYTQPDFLRYKGIYENSLNQLLSKEKFDACVITGGPYYAMAAAPLLKKEYNLPYILDFRDLWTFDTMNTKLTKLVLMKTQYKFERAAVRKSSRVVVVSDIDRKIMRKNYFTNKVSLIYNGYNENSADFLYQLKDMVDNKLKVGIFGKLSYYDENQARKLFLALQSLEDTGVDTAFLNLGEKDLKTESIIERVGYSKDKYISTGYLPYSEGIEKLKECDVCVVVRGNFAGLGTKVFDYIALNKPIITICPKGTEAYKFMDNFENGFACTNANEIEEVLKYILKNKIQTLSYDNSIRERYSRKAQNEIFYNLIKEVSNKK